MVEGSNFLAQPMESTAFLDKMCPENASGDPFVGNRSFLSTGSSQALIISQKFFSAASNLVRKSRARQALSSLCRH